MPLPSAPFLSISVKKLDPLFLRILNAQEDSRMICRVGSITASLSRQFKISCSLFWTDFPALKNPVIRGPKGCAYICVCVCVCVCVCICMAGREGDNRRWDGWMASPTRCTWVWASCVSWWRTGKPGMLQSMGLQRVGHNWLTELTDIYLSIYI